MFSSSVGRFLTPPLAVLPKVQDRGSRPDPEVAQGSGFLLAEFYLVFCRY